MIVRKTGEPIEQRIQNYESVINFYERNRDGRFQDKKNLYIIAENIDLELEKKHKKEHFAKLSSLQNRIEKFVCPRSLNKNIY